jgi:hypothetical protein
MMLTIVVENAEIGKRSTVELIKKTTPAQGIYLSILRPEDPDITSRRPGRVLRTFPNGVLTHFHALDFGWCRGIGVRMVA